MPGPWVRTVRPAFARSRPPPFRPRPASIVVCLNESYILPLQSKVSCGELVPHSIVRFKPQWRLSGKSERETGVSLRLHRAGQIELTRCNVRRSVDGNHHAWTLHHGHDVGVAIVDGLCAE